MASRKAGQVRAERLAERRRERDAARDTPGDNGSDEAASSGSPGVPKSMIRRPVPTFLAAVAVLIHIVFVMAVTMWAESDTASAAVLLAPAVLTYALIPDARWHGLYRWLVLLAAPLISAPGLGLLVALCVEAWIVDRFWLVEYAGKSVFARGLSVGSGKVRR